MSETHIANKRKTSTPPDGYLCNLCSVPGHWIQQCSMKKGKKKKSDHNPVSGVDPSEADIDRARELQKIKAPNCFCGEASRLKKVKRSKAGGEQSRAIGKYFFFCNKAKLDDKKCRFARPVDDELKPKKERLCTFFVKNGTCKKGDKCMFSHVVGTTPAKKTSAEKPEEKEPYEKEEDKNTASSDSSSDGGSDSSSIDTSSSSDDDEQF